MKSAAFIKIVAEAYRVDEKTVALYARLLKEAGWLSTGGRGRHAPHMTPLDLARMTIALLATDKPARAVERLERFRTIPFNEVLSDIKPGEYLKIEETSDIEQVLETLFSSGGLEEDNPFEGHPYIEFNENSRKVTIEFAHEGIRKTAIFLEQSRTEEQRNQDAKDLFGIRKIRGLASAELLKTYVPFYIERRDGVFWEDVCKEDGTAD